MMYTAPSTPERINVSCGYCGEPVPANVDIVAAIGGTLEPMCCHGCAALVFLAGDGQPGKVLPTVQQRLAVDGISCANCVKAIERGMNRTVGVAYARVDSITQEIDLAFDERLVSLARLRSVLRRLGYETALVNDAEALHQRSRRTALKGVLLSWLFMMQVMMLSGPTYLAGPGDIAPDLAQLMRIAEALLTLPTLIFCGRPIFRSALRALRFGQIGADLPVVIGIVAAFITSVLSIVRGTGAVYFDSITMFLALLLTSRWLQQRGLDQATSYLSKLGRHDLPTARRIRDDGGVEDLKASSLQPGDLILVRPGEVIAADGVIEQGSGHCSEALLTGESTPLAKSPGCEVLAGSTNMDAVLKLRVRLAGTATTLATIGRLAASAARERPSAITFAERVAPFMVALVLAFTIAAGVYWWHAGPTKAFEVMLAVLVITCPCALSLAAPAALAAAQAAMAARGILVARLNVIEQLAKSDSVVLDKTGTLTTGRMEVSRVEVLRQGFTAPTIIRIAAALELASNHPIAQAICRANSKPVEVAANLEVVSGAGVSGELDGRSYRIGAAVYAMNGQPLPTLDDDAGVNSSMALLADGDGPIGRLYLEDPERDDARCFVASLACPKRTVTILSGDTQNTVSTLANSMQIPAALGDMKPIDKKNYVAEMQRHGNTVFMIGDGINDAPVIAQADVSAAFATATTLAQTRADIIVLGNRFADVQAAMAIAQQTIRIIRQNLGWAFVYNIVAIPVAASGVLTPLGAAVGMSVSSLVVVGNALRLLPKRHA